MPYRRPLICAVLLAGCGGRELANVPPEVLEDCRREVALLSEQETSLPPEESLRQPADETLPDPIEDARAAKEDADEVALSEWPEEALLYRCFLSRGLKLTDEQARTLAQYQDLRESD